MKRIIRRKVYDTDTATRIGSWSSGHYTSDFDWCARSLYRTPRGNWFEHGEGGARSIYRVSRGNSVYGGGRITTLTEAQALDWIEQYADQEDADAAMQFFGGLVELA